MIYRFHTDLRKFLLLLVATWLGACGLPPGTQNWSEPSGSVYSIGPYILLGAEGEAFIVVSAEVAQPPLVRWISSEEQGSVPMARTGDIWVAHLTGLSRGPEISYQVHSALGESPKRTFRVDVAPGEAFRFAAFGDTRTGHSVHRSVVEAVAREKIAFVLHTGDMVERGGKRHQWRQFFQIERPLLESTPILPAVGNHDMSSRHYFRHYFLHRLWAKNRRYYKHDWGNLRVVAMDGGIECRDGCAQYAFARRVLQEGADKGMFIVMMLHYPPYSSGAHGSHDGVQEPITELARRYGVELVLAGHDHHYERTKPIYGTTYVVSGSAGAPIRPVRPQPFTAVARTEPHYVLVDVLDDRMVLRAINLDGNTFDSVVLKHTLPDESR